MSASERLKALEEGITAGEWTANDPARFVPSLTVGRRHKFTGRTYSEADARFCAAMANTLPELIAVVEAVENALEQDHGDGPPTMEIGAALAALDAKLANE